MKYEKIVVGACSCANNSLQSTDIQLLPGLPIDTNQIKRPIQVALKAFEQNLFVLLRI